MSTGTRHLRARALAAGFSVLMAVRATLANGFVDALIRNAGEAAFIGGNAFAIEKQTKVQTVETGQTASFEMEVRYLGVVPDRVRVTAPAASHGWTVRYFDALAGSREITREVTSNAGWVWASVLPGASRFLRAEITPGVGAVGEVPKDLLVTAAPDSAPNRQDTVKASTICAPRTQPDLSVRREFDLRYVGDNRYNSTGVGQTKAQETDPDLPAPYFIQLANDGNRTDRFLVEARSSEVGWTVRYFDALVGGNEITESVTGAGWLSPPLALNATRELRVEVSGGTNVQGVSVSQVRVTATSQNDPAKSDTVRLVTAIIPDSTVPQGGVYTTDADFEKGTLAGVTYEAVPDQLQQAGESITLPFLWVPNSNQGTVSKVDTRTGRELARYRTGPEFRNGNPSRTTIDQRGNCWVANRQTGTVIQIGLLENGQDLDRNQDGRIQTSSDLNGDGDITGDELLPWGEDECVLWEVVLIPDREGTFVPGTFTGEYANDNWNPGPRGVAVDARGNVWLGTYETKKFYHLDGHTGQILRTVDFAMAPHNSYGAVIDAQGIVWSSGLNTKNLLRLDPTDGTFTVLDLEHSAYGLGLDRSNHLYVAGWTSAKLSRVNVLTGEREWTVPGIPESRGVTVTEDGDVWTADSKPGTVTRWSADGAIKASIPVGNTPTGVTVDAAGKVWVVNNGDEFIKRIDPLTDEVDLAKRILGGNHYGYSDMTGIISRTATTRLGVWTTIHDSRFPGAAWGTLSWTATVPSGTRAEVRARSSPDRRHWSFWDAAANGMPLRATPPGKFLQVEVTLQTIEGTVSPVLYDLAVAPVDEDQARPSLQYRVIERDRLELAWDLNLVGAVLETASQVTGGWAAVEGVVGNRFIVPFEAGVPSRFYRLRLD